MAPRQARVGASRPHGQPIKEKSTNLLAATLLSFSPSDGHVD
jgi:hypothetical protein